MNNGVVLRLVWRAVAVNISSVLYRGKTEQDDDMS
jgi:hypothetical protein